jgi:hypothetical protein
LAVDTFDWKNALEVCGSFARPPIAPAILEERREALRVAFAEGPHECQEALRRLEMALRLLVVSEPSGGGEVAGAPSTRRDECVRTVFRADNLVRLIVSFL